jgi:hypothetical protein
VDQSGSLIEEDFMKKFRVIQFILIIGMSVLLPSCQATRGVNPLGEDSEVVGTQSHSSFSAGAEMTAEF